MLIWAFDNSIKKLAAESKRSQTCLGIDIKKNRLRQFRKTALQKKTKSKRTERDIQRKHGNLCICRQISVYAHVKKAESPSQKLKINPQKLGSKSEKRKQKAKNNDNTKTN